MGICKLCGGKTGLLRKEHKECRLKHDKALGSLPLYIADHLFSHDVPTVVRRTREAATKAFINEQELADLFVRGWELAVNRAFDDGILSEDEEDKLTTYADYFSFGQKELDVRGWFSRMVHGAVLREIMDGKIPERQRITSPLPFNFMKSEKLIWLFQDVPYFEAVTRTRYVGGNQGVSLRVMKGVYYRTGAFKGERIQTEETRHVDTGLFAVTTKHVYFTGASKSFRIKYEKIVSFEPLSDGICIHKDSASAKPQLFATGDGWFIYNLLMNIGNLE